MVPARNTQSALALPSQRRQEDGRINLELPGRVGGNVGRAQILNNPVLGTDQQAANLLSGMRLGQQAPQEVG